MTSKMCIRDRSADTGDEDDRYYEEVAVVAEVNGLYHLETGHCDEAVKRCV